MEGQRERKRGNKRESDKKKHLVAGVLGYLTRGIMYVFCS